jgi:hypothetical protein
VVVAAVEDVVGSAVTDACDHDTGNQRLRTFHLCSPMDDGLHVGRLNPGSSPPCAACRSAMSGGKL